MKLPKSLGIISESTRGWTKELNMVSWNDREPKYDIREWNPDHTRMGKGITLSQEEIDKLKEILNGDMQDTEDEILGG